MSSYLMPNEMAYYLNDGEIIMVRVIQNNIKEGITVVEMPDGSFDNADPRLLFADKESAITAQSEEEVFNNIINVMLNDRNKENGP